MDSLSLVITALAEGSAACARADVPVVVVSAYQELRALVVGYLAEDATLVDALARSPVSGGAFLGEELRESEACTDPAVAAAARRLLALLHPSDSSEVTPGQDPAGSPGVEATVPRVIPTRSGYLASSADEVVGGVFPPGRPGPTGTQGTGIPDGHADRGLAVTRGGRRPAPARVILIDCCSGIQVGDRNTQLSSYIVTLEAAAFASAQELSELLLGPGTPWVRDVFSHDAELRPPQLAASPDPGFQSILPTPDGDTLVIVRNSHGVQVGDHNVQRNEFRIVVAAVTVQADALGMTGARRTAVDRLLDDPADTGAAEELAAELAGAAETAVLADVTFCVLAEFGESHIQGWPQNISNRAGAQVGEHSESRIRPEVTVTKFDADALAREISAAAKLAAIRKLLLEADAPITDSLKTPAVESPAAVDRRQPPLSAM